MGSSDRASDRGAGSEVAQHVQARPWVRWVEDDDDSDGGKRQSGAPLVDWAKGMIASGPPLPLLALLTQPTARVPRILYTPSA